MINATEGKVSPDAAKVLAKVENSIERDAYIQGESLLGIRQGHIRPDCQDSGSGPMQSRQREYW